MREHLTDRKAPVRVFLEHSAEQSLGRIAQNGQTVVTFEVKLLRADAIEVLLLIGVLKRRLPRE